MVEHQSYSLSFYEFMDMEKQEIIQKIEMIVVAAVNHHDFQMSENTQPNDILGWDSLSNAMILTSIEQEFSIKFKFSDMIAWKTIGELADIITKKIG